MSADKQAKWQTGIAIPWNINRDNIEGNLKRCRLREMLIKFIWSPHFSNIL